MVLGFGGLPLIYMGDELGLLNDHDYESDASKATDNRWMHRPPMRWAEAAHREDIHTIAGRVFSGLVRLIDARRMLPALHAGVAPEVFVGQDPAVVVFRRRHPAGDVVELYNLADEVRTIQTAALWPIDGPAATDRISGDRILLDRPTVALRPLAAMWLTAVDD